MDSTGSTDQSEPKPDEVDYHHGADLLAKICQGPLMKQLVSFKFPAGEVIMSVGKYEIRMLLDPSCSSETVKLQDPNGRIVAQITNVRMAE
jgi:hypothetical protein